MSLPVTERHFFYDKWIGKKFELTLFDTNWLENLFEPLRIVCVYGDRPIAISNSERDYCCQLLVKVDDLRSCIRNFQHRVVKTFVFVTKQETTITNFLIFFVCVFVLIVLEKRIRRETVRLVYEIAAHKCEQIFKAVSSKCNNTCTSTQKQKKNGSLALLLWVCAISVQERECHYAVYLRSFKSPKFWLNRVKTKQPHLSDGLEHDSFCPKYS